MIRHVVAASALVVCAGVVALAGPERATFILTDGEQKSGAVVFHTESRENLIDGHLNLGNDAGGAEFTVPIGQVAVIVFAGGQPSQNELAQLPASGHVLVLRNGQMQAGSFVNLIGGDTLLWRNANGDVQQYAIADASRVYLNPDAARGVFNYTGPIGTAGAVPTPSQQTTPGTVLVQANQAWTDAGLTVKKGDRVAFTTTGQISFGRGENQTAGPDGNDVLRRASYPVAVMPVGGLIGRVGAGAPFPIGSNSQPIVMPADGRLSLGVNDDEPGDNAGYFTVAVRKQ